MDDIEMVELGVHDSQSVNSNATTRPAPNRTPNADETIALCRMEEGRDEPLDEDLSDGPPKSIKLTGYRLLNSVLCISFFTIKGVCAMKKDVNPLLSSMSDWTLGGFVAFVMWWIGYLEAVRPPRYPWFFHVDYYEILKLHFKNQFLEEESETQEALLSRSSPSISIEAIRRISEDLPASASSLADLTLHVIKTVDTLQYHRNDCDLLRNRLLQILVLMMDVVLRNSSGRQGATDLPSNLKRKLLRLQSDLETTLDVAAKVKTAANSDSIRYRAMALYWKISRFRKIRKCWHDLAWARLEFDTRSQSTSVDLVASRLADTSRLVDAVHVADPDNMEKTARLCGLFKEAQHPDPHQYQVLTSLPRAKYAQFDCERPDRPASCLTGTRIGAIKDIVLWITDPGPTAQRLFWLKGLAGTGKTTVSHTIARLARSLGVLGATFFFSRRGEDELRNPALVFPTIAYQLASLDPKFCEHITAALKAEPQAPTASLKEQLDALIITPLAKLERDNERVVIILFDAFDECEAVGARIILRLLLTAIPFLPFCVKIFVSSRPEAHIRSILIPSNPVLQITALHEIESSIVQSDILLYLRTEIRRLPQRKGLVLPPDWVTEVQIELLARAAGDLFIFAATLLRSLEEACSLPEQLDSLLKLATKPRNEDDESNPFVYLDELYLEVLRRPIIRSNRVQILMLLQVVLGTIVLLRDPLPVDALERLTGMRNGDAVATLNALQSVILPPSPHNYCPRTYHSSFSDFLQDPARCLDSGLFIDTQKHEQRIAIRCLELLNAKLPARQLKVLDPRHPNSGIEDLKDQVQSAFPAELQYACQYWASHLANAPHTSTELNVLLGHFASQKLIPWTEAINWLGFGAHGLECLETARSWAAKSSTSEETILLLNDGYQLLAQRSRTGLSNLQLIRKPPHAFIMS